MKHFFLAIIFICACLLVSAQNKDSVVITGEEYIPVEGRGEVPGKLEGYWILHSGLNSLSNKKHTKATTNKSATTPIATSKQSTTSTKTKNGVTTTTTTTTTESEVKYNKEKAKKITPAQGSKLHNPQKPSLSFYGLNQTFTGFTGCNKFSGRFTSKGNAINLTSANPSTKMVCIGEYDEAEFINKIERVNAYKINSGRLQLLGNGSVLLTFVRQ